MNTNKNIDKLLEKLLSSGEEQVLDIGFCMLKSGLRISEIRNKHPENSCLLEARDSNNLLNKEPHCLTCQNAISTVKHNPIAEKNTEYKLSPNSFRHAYSTNYFRYIKKYFGVSED